MRRNGIALIASLITAFAMLAGCATPPQPTSTPAQPTKAVAVATATVLPKAATLPATTVPPTATADAAPAQPSPTLPPTTSAQAQPTATSQAASAPAGEYRLIYYIGFMTEDGKVDLDPWEEFTDTVDVPDTTGPYAVQAVDAGGKVLASQKLDLQWWTNSNPPAHISEAPFEGAMRFPVETVKFLVLKDKQVLKELPVSKNAPKVTDVAPATSTEIGGPFSITWKGSDADGEALSYTVEFCPDVTDPEAELEVLVSDLDEPQWDEDFSAWSGGPHAVISVTATDGVLTGAAESAEFVVPFKAPEVFIYPPEDGTEYEVGDEVYLEADAYDEQDEWLPDESLQWSSDISGPLGAGTELYVDDLPAGKHTITLTATNSVELTASDKIVITVTK